LVSTAWPVKVPDGFGGGAEGVGGGGVYAGAVVFLTVGSGLAGLVADGLVADGLVADGLVVGGIIVGVVGVADGEVADGEVAACVGVIGVVSAVTVGTWVLYENSAASPATVPPRARTARRMQPP
jgi:hypothetical protein